MSVKIRLTRTGTNKKPFYRIVVMDSRKKRDGAFLENLGIYHPLEKEGSQTKIEEERIRHWLKQGARPSHTVKALLNKRGIKIE